ncbi:golgin subfamily A member 5-like [Rhopilema esculentum]|uniref:golgin subfamily A member 5-like n=1 Tax=Rhopilema esculentum TaxID=499914 RepID=UPI0031D49E2E|eukprot:gene3139-1444_t
MSWFSDLAKGAEALLEKVDQQTASALQKEQERAVPSVPTTISLESTKDENAHREISSIGTDSKSLPEATKSTSFSTKSVARSSSASNVKKKTDEQLFEFLNSGQGLASGSDKKMPPLTSTPIKPKLQYSQKQPMEQEKPTMPSTKVPEVTKSDDIATELPKTSERTEKKDMDTVAKKSEDSASAIGEVDNVHPIKSDGEGRHDRVSNLQLENRLLKGEIASLNEELANALKRVKISEEGVAHLEAKLEHAQNQMLQQDRIVRGTEEKEKDLNEALNAKDSQLAVLRVRMQEADEELASKRELVMKLTTENQRILKDHTDSTGLQSVALDSFKDKLEEKEKEYQQVQTDFNKAQSEIMELREKLQKEQLQMAESVKSLQLKLSEEKGRIKDLDQNLRSSKDAADSAQRDLKEYKDKATRILQAKEKLINSLKQGAAGSDAPQIVFTELEEIRQERDFLREELQQSKYKLEQMKVELYEVEQQSQSEAEEQQQQVDSLEKSLIEEREKRQHFEEELSKSKQEVILSKEDLHRQMTRSSTALEERDAEIKRLNHQISLKTSMSPSQEELENRVHAITDNLIQKQTLIERLSTEKNSLSLQLERLEQQYRDVQQHLTKSNAHLRHNHSHFDVEDGDEVHASSLASIMPSGVTQSRRWKNTVNVIDKFSIRLGVFLKRYPIARLFVIVYMFLLHLWVTIVLLTYQPEIHSKNSKLPDHHS